MSGQNDKRQKIAVVGGGVAGIVAAYLLQRKHDVTLLEQNDYLGGHTHTVVIPDGPDAGLAVDTGFIVLNDTTYPLFSKFLASLDVSTRLSDMSFGFHCRQSGLLYAGTDLNGLFARRRNLVSPRFLRFLYEIGRFCAKAKGDLDAGAVPAVTLGEYLQGGRFSPFMIENYIVPMGAAIWSTPAGEVADYPAQAFLAFFRNHGLLSLRNRPNWMSVVGGSHSYVKAFVKGFSGEIRLKARVISLLRSKEGVTLFLGGERRFFDRVVIATHADQALRLLGDPSPEETRLLGPWIYQKNRTVLHTDISLLPPERRAWASWNFTRGRNEEGNPPVFVTYHMNRLQGLPTPRDYLVTLNRDAPYPRDTIIAEMEYHHPLYTFASMATQSELAKLNGAHRTFFCGSYFGYGFHEDAVRSAVAVAAFFGVAL